MEQTQNWFQFIVTIGVGLAGIFIGSFLGRFWERTDRQLKKDKEFIEQIINILPIEGDTLYFLRTHDFGSAYQRGETESIWKLRSLLNQPSYFFINRKLEKVRKSLKQDINDFEELIRKYMFVSERRSGYWELADPNEIIKERYMYKKHKGQEMSEDEYNEYSQKVKNNYDKTVKSLNLLANNICEKYDNLMALAREIL